MNDDTEILLRQFIPEARDLLEQASSSLLALEREPAAAEPLNALFRAVHTLKGTSGLFAVEPLTRLVHAGEDVLFAVQAGSLALAADLTDALLESLDQVSLWIDALAENSKLPAGAEAASQRGVARLRAMLATGAAHTAPDSHTAAQTALPAWLDGMRRGAAHAAQHGPSLFAIRYSPDPHCFFRGEDPLALMRLLPGLRGLHVDPVDPWPNLADIDPFACNIRLRALVDAPRDAIEHLFRYALDQAEIVTLPENWPHDGASSHAEEPPPEGHAEEEEERASMRAAMLAVLDGQRRLLLAAGEPETATGRRAAAVRALRGVLAQAGRTDLAAGLDAAADAVTRGVQPDPLLAFIDLLAAAQPLALPKPAAAEPPTASPQATSLPATLRVEQAKIDVLMNLVGELVVAKNAIAYLARQAEQGQFTTSELAREIKARHALVNRIADEMQGAVMSVRMLPVEQIFHRFPRLVRDVSRRLGKRVDLIVEGGETEADKNIIEAIADPLIHMVRNSLDHGIEAPEVRLQSGKSEAGTLRLTAAQDNDEVVIRVIDDGRGIDPAAVRRRAIEQGLIDPERARALPDEDAVALVFAPGFSTAPEVTDLSGRGVGMDVVRSAVEKVGGRVSISSRRGLGTTVELVLPLSMAVTRIITVCCGDRMFGVPMSLVVETVRIPRARLTKMRDREAFVLRDSVVPVLRLATLLDLPDEVSDPEEIVILVVRINGERLGLVVGAFREGMEALVKPMEGALAGAHAFSGTTLLGDGRVLLVLDLRELVA